MSKPVVEFWFEFASTYSYLSAMRLPRMAEASGVTVHWRPFLLGPIFAAQGMSDSPFKIFPTKGAYMWRDIERLAARQGVPFRRLERFPQNGLHAARIAQIALHRSEGIAFCHNVYLAEFADGKDISDPETLADCAARAGLPTDILSNAKTPENKLALRHATEAAAERGVFGAPSFLVGDELFWGDDRLQDALDWAIRHG
ncbi:2-hydroxychromene-2-carboxylate isomerase [Sedimentitalea todarodis]|uniref:2-hydroxychromene-2-carboxylate isomerase n=1 Tax=Sedimentitalea todarodis TaxID=1631240 RepID=A0ABU3VGW3_9RHOB|nr:2-hydroxychromene-2-carboxylate isomerase [Sedimentitalea todarodis]MDU9005230.1 2-hydroxychromene-2-carboxylate isomerase [Sedimentitalea todarodis]